MGRPKISFYKRLMIIELYKKGKSYKEIEKILNLYRFVIVSYLQKAKINGSRKKKIRKNVLEKDKKIISLRLQGMSSREVDELLGLKKHTTSKQLRGRINPRPTYQLDENTFNNIDTPEKAYWLGVAFANGSTRARGHIYNPTVMYLFRILSVKKILLEGFSKFIKSNYPVVKEKRTFLLRIRNKKIVTDLINHGCIPNKLTNQKPPNIDNKLVHHFVRGYFDSIVQIYKSKGNSRFTIKCYTESMLNWILDKIKVKDYIKSNKMYYMVTYISSISLKKLHEYLYNEIDNAPHLDEVKKELEKCIK